jgi:hypothetical protein
MAGGGDALKATLVPLARTAFKKYDVSTVFAIPHGQSLPPDALSEGDHVYGTVDERPPLPSNSAGSSMLFSPRRGIEMLSEIAYWRREAHRLLDTYSPSVIFTTNRDIEDGPFLQKLARKRGIPVIRVQWCFHAPEHVVKRQIRAVYLYSLHGAGQTTKQLRLLRRNMGGRLRALAYRLRNVAWSDSTVSAHNVSRYAVTNSIYADQFIDDGVPRTIVDVTGHPEDDLLLEYKKHFNHPEARAEARAEFEIGGDDRVVVFAREFMQSVFGLLDPETDITTTRNILRTIGEFDGAHLILKKHPKDDDSDYDWVRREFPNVRIIGNCDLYKLVAVSDCLVTQGSTVTRWATVASVPAIVVNFSRMEFSPYAARVTGAALADNPSELKKLVADAFDGVFAVKDLRAEPVTDLIDGHACDRILALAGESLVSGD